jgi:hypothetical protein
MGLVPVAVAIRGLMSATMMPPTRPYSIVPSPIMVTEMIRPETGNSPPKKNVSSRSANWSSPIMANERKIELTIPLESTRPGQGRTDILARGMVNRAASTTMALPSIS